MLVSSRVSFAALALCAAAFSLSFAPRRSAAQEEDPVAEAAGLVEISADLVTRGSYEDAERKLARAVKADPGNVDAALLLARVFSETGRLDASLAALSAAAGTRAVLRARAAVLLELGRLEDAGALLTARLEAEPDDVVARQLLGRSLEERGETERAVLAYAATNDAWARSEDADDEEELLAVARARLGLFRLSGEYRANINAVLTRLDEARKLDERRVDVLVEIGELYLRGYQDESAKRWFTKAAEINRNHAPAIFGLAKQLAFRYDEDEARAAANRALRANENFVPALLFLAQMELGDGRYGEAESLIARAVAAGASAEARATRGALLYVRGDQPGFAEAERGDERYRSILYRVVASVMEEQRRFPEALLFAEKAVAANDRDFDAMFLAGRNAMNVGQDDKAQQYLERADKDDPFDNVYRHNFLLLFNKMAKFPARRDTTFVVKLPPAEDEAYHPLLRDALGRSLEDLQARWDFHPELPLFVSVFDQQQDFASRTIGLPGFPALGACFGRVVTLDSPRALPPGAFGWRATQHHELAHVITLELSKGRVPRWLTEGLSVYEERKASPQWFREMERDLINARASDEVLPLDEINAAFRGSRVMFAYYQGGLMCEMIERDFGFPKLREMVRLYGDGLDTPDVVKRVLGVDSAEFDRRFLAYVDEYVGELRVLPRLSRTRITSLKRELRARPDDAEGWRSLALGYAMTGPRGTSDALSALGKAVELDPEHPRLHVIRAAVARAQKRPDQAVEQAALAIENGEDWWEMRHLLVDRAVEKEDFEAAKTHLRAMIRLFPVESGPDTARVRLAGLLLGEGEEHLAEAMTLLRAHADVAEDDFATRQRLATYYRDGGDTEAELATLLELRDVVPLPNGQAITRADAVALHRRLADLFAAAERHADEEVARRVAVGVARMSLAGRGDEPTLDPSELADLLVEHAGALRLLGRLAEARDRVREAVGLDPENDAAQDLLERLPAE